MTSAHPPEGYRTVTPYLPVAHVEKVITFLEEVFDAEPVFQIDGEGGVQHAELRIGDSIVMIGEPPTEERVMPAMLYVYVSNPDAAYERALQAGATSVKEPADQGYGDRAAAVEDVAGNQWWLAKSLDG